MENTDAGKGMEYCEEHMCWYPLGEGCPKCNEINIARMEVKYDE